jgi:SAM-dependent methyltransferase
MPETDLQKWDARYREQGPVCRERTPFLLFLDALLPRRGRALEVAGGTGRHALWLARRGLDVTLADISSVALEIAQADAVSQGGPLRTMAIDLEAEPLPGGPWELIVIADFLWRPLFDLLPSALAPGGWRVVAHPTESNLQRHSRPGLRHPRPELNATTSFC